MLFELPVEQVAQVRHAHALADERARLAISEDLGRTLFVEAGAGSGKTSSMVDRIVQLVRREHAQLEEIAAVTFTDAAAAELRARVRRRLASSAVEDGAGSPAAAALAQIDEAAIGTIHGLCQRLLAEHPLEAGLPPGFAVLDEVRASIAWRGRWTATLDLLVGEEGTRQLIAAAWVLGMDHRHLEAIARILDEQWDRCDSVPRDPAALLATIRGATDRGTAEVSSGLSEALSRRADCLEPSDGLVERFAVFETWLAQLGVAGSWIDRLRLLAAGPGRSLRVATIGKAPNWSGSSLGEVRSLLAEVEQARTSAVAVACDAALGGLVSRLEGLALEAADVRRINGELSFHDLLVRARDIVAEDPAVRSELRRRFRYLLVDEFQDTDPLQLELVELLATAPTGPEPGRLFLVGDPKQAIYRFRGADLRVYEEARARLRATPIALTTSFRAVPGIIDFVNATFADLMGDRFAPLHVNRGSVEGAVPVRIVGGALETASAAERRLAEAEAVADAILEATGHPGWLVADEADEVGDGRLRRAQLADIAVLLPTRTGLSILEDALDERQISYRVESVTLVYGSQEVRDLLALARAIDEPGNEAALAATLRSPAFACADDDMLDFRRGGGLFSLSDPVPGTLRDSRVGAAIRELGELRARRHVLGPAGVLLRALTDRRVLQIAGSGPRARESWRRLRYVLEQARGFVEAGGGGLAEFADWVDEQVAGNLRAIESTVPEDDEDAVRIMTIHGAKGLEFPVTILAGLGADRRGRQGGATILRDEDGRAEVQVYKDRSTGGYLDLAAKERLLETEEDLRLLYVAATRARDHLVICGHHTPVTSGEASLAERLLAAAERAAAELAAAGQASADWWTGPDIRTSRSLPAAPEGAAEPSGAERASDAFGETGVPGGTPEQYERWRRSREELFARIGRGESVAATEIPALARVTEEAVSASIDDELPPWGRGRAGTQVGRAVHAVLQSVDLAPFGDGASPRATTSVLRPVALAQARAERIPERSREIEHLAGAALSSPVVLEAIRSGTARREVFVAVPVGGRLLEGFIDLCFDDGVGLVIVDYKTDTVPSEADIERAYERYRFQAAAYALALGTATGRPVRRCVLLFLASPGRPVEREVTDLPALVSEVRSLVSGVD
ncbi:MAG TPA: UvrD-helicase domain-containing protein [Acidimicrobiales bacterium]|nr:UvrD-helicase domain-containing protein [Acidimicrobiales bacterium]